MDRFFTGPVGTKVLAAAAGSGLGAASAGFLVWALGVAVWGASSDAAQAADAIAAVPAPVSGLLGLLITIGGTFVAGYAKADTAGRHAAPDA